MGRACYLHPSGFARRSRCSPLVTTAGSSEQLSVVLGLPPNKAGIVHRRLSQCAVIASGVPCRGAGGCLRMSASAHGCLPAPNRAGEQAWKANWLEGLLAGIETA